MLEEATTDPSRATGAEQELRRSEARYRSLAEATASTIWTTSAKGLITEPQPRWEAYTGQTWQEYRDDGWFRAFDDDDRPELMRRWAEALATAAPYEASGRLWHAATARFRRCEMRAVPVLDGAYGIREWVGTTTDVDDRHRALDLLSAGEARAQLAESAARFGTWEWDLADRVLWSESMEALFGFEPGAYPGTFAAFMERVHPEDRERVASLIERSVADRAELDFEHRAVLPGGVVRWIHGRGRLVADAGGKPLRLVGIGMDVTDRRAALADLHAKEARDHILAKITAALVASLDGPAVLGELARLAVPELADICAIGLFEGLDETVRFETAGVDARERPYVVRIHLRHWLREPGATEQVGEAVERGEGILFADFTPATIEACAPNDEQREAARGVGATSVMCVPLVARGESIGMATFAMTRSGRHYTADDLALICEIAGRASIAVANAHLVAELRETADELRETADGLRRANAAKDEFLGLVSHELKTPITTIMGNAEVLHARFDLIGAEARGEALEDMRRESERLDRIVDNLLILARLDKGQQLEAEPLHLPQLTDRIVSAHTRAFPGRKLSVAWAEGATLAMGVGANVEQILRNLLSNAEKYSPRTSPIDLRSSLDGETVTISVCDRGPGIRAGEAEAVFDPFYRSELTSGKVSGIGIGLTVCKRLVEAQGGRLWYAPREGGGAVFAFTLPAVPPD